MIEMSLQEAQLFRMLEAFFGRDRVVWNMSVRSVCGGEYPVVQGQPEESVARWAEICGCLFTVVDGDDNPKMVVEIGADPSHAIDVAELDRQQRLPELLRMRGVQYVLVSNDEFEEMLDPNSSLDLVSVLKDRFGIDDAQDENEDSE